MSAEAQGPSGNFDMPFTHYHLHDPAHGPRGHHKLEGLLQEAAESKTENTKQIIASGEQRQNLIGELGISMTGSLQLRLKFARQAHAGSCDGRE